MNLNRVERFARELHAIVSEAEKVEAQMDQLGGVLEVAGEMQDLQQAGQIEQRKKALAPVLATITGLATRKANRADLEGARILVYDLQARINAAHQEREQLSAALTEFEFKRDAGELTQELRAGEEAKLTALRARLELRVKHAADLVPDKPVVLLT